MNLSRARRFVQVGLGILLVGSAVIAWMFQHYSAAQMPVPASLTVFVAFVVAGSGLMAAYVGWRTLRLASPANTIARWVVSVAEWERYAAACRMRISMPGALPGAVPLDLAVPATGIEVLALRRGFRIGESFHEIGTLGAEVLDMRVVDSPAAMFEFNMIYATGRTSSVRLGVRVPIAAGAEALANRVEAHWIAREPLQVMTVDALRARERAGWTITIVGFVLFLGVIGLFIVINPPGWAAVGPGGTLALTLFGFFRAYRARAVRWKKEGRT